MQFLKSLNEARKNPALNAKTNLLQELNSIKATLGKIPGSDVTNGFVTFSPIEKVGVNPNFGHTNVFGIYFYDIDYVIEQLSKSRAGNPINSKIPYGKSFPIINVVYCKSPEKLFMVEDLNDDFFKSFIEHCKHLTKTKSLHERDLRAIDALIENLTYIQGDVKKFRLIMDSYDGISPLIQMAVFKSMKICGLVDTGRSLIHVGEPRQSVIFNSSDLVFIKSFNNKTTMVADQSSHLNAHFKPGAPNKIGDGINVNKKSGQFTNPIEFISFSPVGSTSREFYSILQYKYEAAKNRNETLLPFFDRSLDPMRRFDVYFTSVQYFTDLKRSLIKYKRMVAEFSNNKPDVGDLDMFFMLVDNCINNLEKIRHTSLEMLTTLKSKEFITALEREDEAEIFRLLDKFSEFFNEMGSISVPPKKTAKFLADRALSYFEHHEKDVNKTIVSIISGMGMNLNLTVSTS